jgi:putative nucleotidyltransferase with HDIG domain
VTSKPILQSLRRFLHGVLERLDRIEKTSVRSQSLTWYRQEWHIPPVIIGMICVVLLFALTVIGTNSSILKMEALALFVIVLVALFGIYLVRDQRELAQSDDAMSLLAVAFFISLFAVKLTSFYAGRYPWLTLYMAPFGIAPLLVAILLNPRLGLVVSFLVAIMAGILDGFNFGVMLAAAVGGATLIAFGGRARSTQQVARAGILAGVAQAMIVLFIAANENWNHPRWMYAGFSAFASGILSSVITLGIMPYLEDFFSRISNLRLTELAAVNHPLLKQMSMEAPGTYHHSMIVASLAEDAANAIGANGLLCRVGAYFHDIGKMSKAEYFIENQGTFGNPHDEVSPSLSKIVISSHVKEGLALAKQHKIDKQVADFIPQHHGTSQIEYFYLKALELEGRIEGDDKEIVQEETYRYPGPKPQTKEAGIVMLSDSVEGASRTLEDPNHQRYKDLVLKIINKKLFDEQLDETPLTLKDLNIIAERFTATLVSVHHARIPYPDADAITSDQ